MPGPGGLRGARPKGPPLPKERRKKLYWKAIPEDRLNTASGSIWADAPGHMSDVQIDMKEFEQLFVEKLDAVEKKMEPKAEKKAPTTITLLDGKRAMNTAIAIARIKLSYSETREAIHTMSVDALALDQLQSLLEYMPTSEEVETLKNFSGEVDKLGEAEKFMLEMTKVKNPEAKIKGMIYRLCFHDRITELRDTAALLEAACDDVKLSLRLKKLLGIILKLGNELNQGQTSAFTLDSLLKLNTAKAFDKKTSILHYLVVLVERNDRNLLDFKDDLKNVFPASRLMISAITQEQNELEKNLASFKALVEGEPDLQPPHPPPSSPMARGPVPVTPRGGGPQKTSSNDGAMTVGADGKPTRRLTVLHLAHQKTENRTVHLEKGKVLLNFDSATETPSPRESGRLLSDEDGAEKGLGEAPPNAGSSGGDGKPLPKDPRLALAEFLRKAERELEHSKRTIESTLKKVANVLAYFGEDPELSPADFFTTLHHFIKAFDEARAYVDRQAKVREREAKLAEKKALQEARALQRSLRSSVPTPAVTSQSLGPEVANVSAGLATADPPASAPEGEAAMSDASLPAPLLEDKGDRPPGTQSMGRAASDEAKEDAAPPLEDTPPEAPSQRDASTVPEAYDHPPDESQDPAPQNGGSVMKRPQLRRQSASMDLAASPPPAAHPSAARSASFPDGSQQPIPAPSDAPPAVVPPTTDTAAEPAPPDPPASAREGGAAVADAPPPLGAPLLGGMGGRPPGTQSMDRDASDEDEDDAVPSELLSALREAEAATQRMANLRAPMRPQPRPLSGPTSGPPASLRRPLTPTDLGPRRMSLPSAALSRPIVSPPHSPPLAPLPGSLQVNGTAALPAAPPVWGLGNDKSSSQPWLAPRRASAANIAGGISRQVPAVPARSDFSQQGRPADSRPPDDPTVDPQAETTGGDESESPEAPPPADDPAGSGERDEVAEDHEDTGPVVHPGMPPTAAKVLSSDQAGGQMGLASEAGGGEELESEPVDPGVTDAGACRAESQDYEAKPCGLQGPGHDPPAVGRPPGLPPSGLSPPRSKANDEPEMEEDDGVSSHHNGLQTRMSSVGSMSSNHSEGGGELRKRKKKKRKK